MRLFVALITRTLLMARILSNTLSTCLSKMLSTDKLPPNRLHAESPTANPSARRRPVGMREQLGCRANLVS